MIILVDAARGSAGGVVDAMRYACDVTISRCSGFMLQPRSISSTASQSSSSAFTGDAPLTPKLNTVATKGSPKCRIHSWFAATTAVSGLLRSAIHRASARAPARAGGRIELIERRIIGAILSLVPSFDEFFASCFELLFGLRPFCFLLVVGCCEWRQCRHCSFGNQYCFFGRTDRGGVHRRNRLGSASDRIRGGGNRIASVIGGDAGFETGQLRGRRR